MTVSIIPTGDDTYYQQTTDLDGQEYVLDFRFNTREKVWYLTICDTGSNAIVGGIKVVVGFPLLNRFSDPRLPPGDIYCLTSTQDNTPPGQEELGYGLRCCLFYYDVNEFQYVPVIG